MNRANSMLFAQINEESTQKQNLSSRLANLEAERDNLVAKIGELPTETTSLQSAVAEMLALQTAPRDANWQNDLNVSQLHNIKQQYDQRITSMTASADATKEMYMQQLSALEAEKHTMKSRHTSEAAAYKESVCSLSYERATLQSELRTALEEREKDKVDFSDALRQFRRRIRGLVGRMHSAIDHLPIHSNVTAKFLENSIIALGEESLATFHETEDAFASMNSQAGHLELELE